MSLYDDSHDLVIIDGLYAQPSVGTAVHRCCIQAPRYSSTALAQLVRAAIPSEGRMHKPLEHEIVRAVERFDLGHRAT